MPFRLRARRAALLASAVFVLPCSAWAANFAVTSGTDTVAKTVGNDDTGSVSSGAALQTAGTGITWTGGSTNPGVVITNSGTISTGNRGIDTSGAFATGSLSITNNAGAKVLTTDDTLDDSAIVTEAGFDLDIGGHTTMNLFYTGQYGSSVSLHALQGGFTVRF